MNRIMQKKLTIKKRILQFQIHTGKIQTAIQLQKLLLAMKFIYVLTLRTLTMVLQLKSKSLKKTMTVIMMILSLYLVKYRIVKSKLSGRLFIQKMMTILTVSRKKKKKVTPCQNMCLLLNVMVLKVMNLGSWMLWDGLRHNLRIKRMESQSQIINIQSIYWMVQQKKVSRTLMVLLMKKI